MNETPEPTPIDTLNAAIQQYIEAIDTDHGELGGWVLVWQEQFLVSEVGMLPIQTTRDIMFGPMTTIETASGLVRYAVQETDDYLQGYFPEADED